MRYLILLTLVCFVFPISANSTGTSSLQGNFEDINNHQSSRYIANEKPITALVMRCRCYENDIIFDDHLGHIQVVIKKDKTDEEYLSASQLLVLWVDHIIWDNKEHESKLIASFTEKNLKQDLLHRGLVAAKKLCHNHFSYKAKDFFTAVDDIMVGRCLFKTLTAEDNVDSFIQSKVL